MKRKDVKENRKILEMVRTLLLKKKVIYIFQTRFFVVGPQWGQNKVIFTFFSLTWDQCILGSISDSNLAKNDIHVIDLHFDFDFEIFVAIIISK